MGYQIKNVGYEKERNKKEIYLKGFNSDFT